MNLANVTQLARKRHLAEIC